jgi:hypothetical protein
MIDDLSRSLRAILDDPGLAATFPDLAAAQISFEHPSETFNPSQTTVDLFLYGVRENVDLRDNQPNVTRLNGQVAVRRPALRVECSYLVTAWPVGGVEPALQEHRLLGQALQVLSALPTIPPGFLQGVLVGQEPPLPMLTAQSSSPSNPAELWTSLGSRFRPSFTLNATVAVPVGAPVLAPSAITHEVRIEQIGLPGTDVQFFQIGGRVTNAANAPVAGATVLLIEPDLGTTTDADGRFRLASVAAGTFTLRATLGAATQQVTITVPAPLGSSYNVKLP